MNLKSQHNLNETFLWIYVWLFQWSNSMWHQSLRINGVLHWWQWVFLESLGVAHWVKPVYIHYVFAIPNFRGIPWSHEIFRLLKVKRQAYMAPFIIRIARKFGPPIQIVEKSSSNFKNYCFIVYNIRKKSLDNCERLEIQLSSDDFLISVHLWFLIN